VKPRVGSKTKRDIELIVSFTKCPLRFS
jgi:hypothetical protein